MKLIKKITFIIIFLFININAFGAVSGVVDNFQVTQRIATGVVFNPDGTKMYISGMSQNRVYEFDLTTGLIFQQLQEILMNVIINPKMRMLLI